MGALSFVGGVAFYFHFRQLDKDEDMLNQIGVAREAKIDGTKDQYKDPDSNLEAHVPAK
jgi:hypothetical protein